MTIRQLKASLPTDRVGPKKHSVGEGAKDALKQLLRSTKTELPKEFLKSAERVLFLKNSRTGDTVCLPCPLREQEMVAALKALEGCAVAAITDVRGVRCERTIRVNLERVTSFLMSAYITNIDGLDKCNPKTKERIPGASRISALGKFRNVVLTKILRHRPERGAVKFISPPVSRPIRDQKPR